MGRNLSSSIYETQNVVPCSPLPSDPTPALMLGPSLKQSNQEGSGSGPQPLSSAPYKDLGGVSGVGHRVTARLLGGREGTRSCVVPLQELKLPAVLRDLRGHSVTTSAWLCALKGLVGPLGATRVTSRGKRGACGARGLHQACVPGL